MAEPIERLSPGRLATLACLLEVSAPKPGNVHRGADFEDVTFEDFVISAVLLGDSLDKNRESGVGSTVLDIIDSTRIVVGTNTNLGLALLLVPLAKSAQACARGALNSQDVGQRLADLDSEDCRLVYEAITAASAGGLGRVKSYDVSQPPPDDLVEAMSLATERDLVARQYANGFRQVFVDAVAFLVEGTTRFDNLSQAIVLAHVRLMSEYPDSLIARKNGSSVAEHSQFLARKCMDVVTNESKFWGRVSDLDMWLRSDGHQRNPGTTADMIAAGLFVALFNGQIGLPPRSP